jgi:hypothetical protein
VSLWVSSVQCHPAPGHGYAKFKPAATNQRLATTSGETCVHSAVSLRIAGPADLAVPSNDDERPCARPPPRMPASSTTTGALLLIAMSAGNALAVYPQASPRSVRADSGPPDDLVEHCAE